MAWNSKKSSFSDYAMYAGIAVVALLGYVFFTASGKVLKDKILNLFTK